MVPVTRSRAASPTVLFLSASVGEGHTAAAQAVSSALAERMPAAKCEVVDSYRYASNVFHRVARNGYIGVVKLLPQLYKFAYDQAERATKISAFKTWLHRYTAPNLRQFVSELKPDVVVCTHAFPCGVMSEYKKQFADSPPVIGVVTDFAVHSFWIHRNIDGYAVATDEMRATMIARGIDPEHIIVSGIPVNASFLVKPLDRATLREELGMPQDRFSLVLMGGGLGIGPLEMMIRALDCVQQKISATVIAGRNKRLHERVMEAAQRVGYPIRVLSFVDNVNDYMHAADALITKPGGLTSAEALVAGIPMVLVKPLPGQEERNTRYLVERKAALRTKNERDLTRKVEEFLKNPERRHTMLAAVEKLAKPRAADDVALLALRIASRTKERTGDHALV